MRNNKRYLSLLLILALCFVLTPQVFAAPSYTEYEAYVERPAAEAGDAFYHGAMYEPKTGAYLAMFAEGDRGMHNWNAPSYAGWYFGKVPELTWKDHAAYMVYVHYSDANAISNYASHFRVAKQLGKAMQICLEPNQGLDAVKYDAHLVSLAQQARDAGIPIFLRFANEFNDTGNQWYKDGPQKFIEKFRLVANVFHQYAPNCAMVWAPNDWPIGSEDAYYPGDEYVDWVGVSSYQVFNANGTPKQSDTWMDRFHLLYEKYGTRKPVFISEGAAVPNVEFNTQVTLSDTASYELRRFYAGAARRYPNLKMIFYWSNNDSSGARVQCSLSSNPTLLAAYRNAIADPYYLPYFHMNSEIYYQKVADTQLCQQEKFSCYVNDVNNRVGKAVYYADGTWLGEGYFPDYTAQLNLAQFVGRNVEFRVDFYAESGPYLTSRSYRVNVVRFADVPSGAYYTEPVSWAVNSGVTAGVDATHFAPDLDCTRSQIVTLLWRAAGMPEPASSNNPFADVPSDAYYAKAVLWAVENGITNGTGHAAFLPDAPCTRGQAVTFLWRAKYQPQPAGSSTPFNDVTAGSYYHNAVLWAVEKHITSGTSQSTFSPDLNCTRAQIVTFLYRAQNA